MSGLVFLSGRFGVVLRSWLLPCFLKKDDNQEPILRLDIPVAAEVLVDDLLWPWFCLLLGLVLPVVRSSLSRMIREHIWDDVDGVIS